METIQYKCHKTDRGESKEHKIIKFQFVGRKGFDSVPDYLAIKKSIPRGCSFLPMRSAPHDRGNY